MKKILLFSSLLFLIACSATKKNFSKSESHVDSLAKVVSKDLVLNKKDSSGSGIIKTNEETKTDGGYSKITTIKEYLSDEFDFGRTIGKDSSNTVLPGSQIIHPGKNKPVLIRETTIKEKGKTSTNINKTTIAENTAKVNTMDSASHDKVAETSLKSETKAVEKTKDKRKFFAWLGIAVIVIVIGYCFFLIKKSK